MSTFQTLAPSTLGRSAFIQAFAEIYEHSPWVAERAFDLGLDASHDQVENLHRRLSEVVRRADRAHQLVLLKAHPDLAGKAAIQGQLSPASSAEQAGAGIQHCSPEEFQRFTELNQAYTARFGFPFIMAVKGRDRQQILAAFETRIQHSPESEFNCALAEIDKIAWLRLQTL